MIYLFPFAAGSGFSAVWLAENKIIWTVCGKKCGIK
jgi:hypothetical protein